MADEGFHEIQLNGKQLVFLFMAATVVSVVIFLCGVMVGRGVRAPMAAAAAATAESPIDPTASVRTSSPTAALTGERVPVSTQEALTYAERLEAPIPPQEAFREEPVIPTAEPVVTAASRDPLLEPDPQLARTAPPAEADAALAEPPGAGFVVQVGAHPRRTAEAIAQGLAAKGYPAFVTQRGGLFAVRVGKYTDRREAEAVADRLERDEQFNNPWVTR